MKIYKALLLRILLTLVIIYSLGSFLATATSYIGKEFFDSTEYRDTQNEYVSKLQNYVLNPADEEASLKTISVTQEEIEYYRNYYGTEAEQILNIQQQYEAEIAVASNVETPNEAYINALVSERDRKIADIQKNFADDQVVIDKITALKSEAIKNYFNNYKRNKQSFLNQYDYFGYTLINETTDEELTRNTDSSKIHHFSKTFRPKGEAISINVYDYIDREGLHESELTIIASEDVYSGTIFVTKDYIESSGLRWEYRGFMLSKWLNYALWAVGIVALFLLLTKYKWSMRLFEPLQPYYEKVMNLSADLHAAILVIALFFTISTFDAGSYFISRIAYGGSQVLSLSFIIWFIVNLAFKVSILSFTIFMVWAMIRRLKEQDRLTLWNNSFTAKFVNLGQNLFLNRTIGVQTVFMFFVFYLGGFGLVVGAGSSGSFAFYLFLFFVVLVPTAFVYLSRMGYLNKIMKQTEQMANGQLTKPIKVKGKSPLAKHAQNLNALQEGVKSSVTAQAKSERLKTELITNVSHDLRTPLTSIITYTDLLKNPDLSAEEREKYVAILDKKADRLKVLIEDLFEVSKMASGNIELVKQKVDVAQLIQQITGEYKSDFEEHKLDLRIDIQMMPIYAYVDGQKLWRVCENLLNNAKKYSMSGTRIYVTLTETNNRAILTVKNVSKYELSGDASELTERFKRADLARHTEGSGLGLAIATSIVHLHGGTLDISADGDLFKVTVELPC